MQKILIQQELDFKIVLDAAAKLEIRELETIVQQFNRLLEWKKSSSKKDRISELEQLVSSAQLNVQELEQYNQLVYKLESRSMTDQEKATFDHLVYKDELLQNQRIAYMIELAQLRDVSFAAIQEQFQFKKTANV